jgi:hypothetical protein
MKLISRKLTISASAILGLGLLSVSQSAQAQSNCKDIKGHTVQIPSAGGGPVTNAGDLTGTAAAVFFGPPFPTNEPNTFSFTFNFTLTTHLGELKATVVNLYDNATGVTTGQGRIDPAASTGRFAGATGILFLSGTTPSFNPFTVELDLSGKICYARE